MSAGAVASLANWGRGAFKLRRQRCASRLLAIEFLARHADHAGHVVGYARRAIGPHVGVDQGVPTHGRQRGRQTFNILQDLAHQGVIAIEAQHDAHGRQIANRYRWLAPWILVQIEGEQRAEELPPVPLPAVRRSPARFREMRERRLELENSATGPPT